MSISDSGPPGDVEKKGHDQVTCQCSRYLKLFRPNLVFSDNTLQLLSFWVCWAPMGRDRFMPLDSFQGSLTRHCPGIGSSSCAKPTPTPLHRLLLWWRRCRWFRCWRRVSRCLGDESQEVCGSTEKSFSLRELVSSRNKNKFSFGWLGVNCTGSIY